jgi:hypothetical protein
LDITPEQLAKSERLRSGEHVSFHHARIEELDATLADDRWEVGDAP